MLPAQSGKPKSVLPATLTHEEREIYFSDKLIRANQLLEPAGNDYVEKLLTTIAVTQQCKMPAEEALLKYFDLLSQYPPDLLHMAGNDYLIKCKYQKFPLISEITADINEIWEMRKKALKETIQSRDSYRNPVKINHDSTSHDGSPRRLGSIISSSELP